MYLLKLDGNSTPFATVSKGDKLNERIALAIREEISADELTVSNENFAASLDWGEKKYFEFTYTEDGEGELQTGTCSIMLIVNY